MSPEGHDPARNPLPAKRFRENYESAIQVAEIERLISDLRARRGELRLPDHPAVDARWRYAEEMHANADSYKTGKEWAVAGDTLEVARMKLQEAFEADRQAVAGRERSEELRRRLDSIRWTDHPLCRDLKKKLDAILAKDGGRWMAAWRSSDLEPAERLLAEADSILGVAEIRNVEAAESIELAAAWRRIEETMPGDRSLDHRIAPEIEERRQRCRTAREAHDRGEFERSLAVWRMDLDPIAELLQKDRSVAEEAASARRQFDQSIGRRPRNRPLSNQLSDGLRMLVVEADGAEECVKRGEYLEAARTLKDAAQRVGRLVADDLEAFAEAEAAREAFVEFETAGRLRRSVWSQRVAEFEAIRTLAVEASGKRDAGDFKGATSDWKEARRRLGVALGEDASHHRESIVALEKFRRKFKSMPARLLDRSVRTDVERLVRRESTLVDWLADGKFSEVEDAVARSVGSLDRLLQDDARLHRMAIEARDDAHAFDVDLPEDLDPAVQSSLRSSASEIDAIELEARQAFDLGEYEDAASTWKRWKDQRVVFGEKAHEEARRFDTRRRRRLVLRGVAIAAVTVIVIAGAVEGFARYRLGGLRAGFEAMVTTSIEHPGLVAERQSLGARLDSFGSGSMVVAPDWFRDHAELDRRLQGLERSIMVAGDLRERLDAQSRDLMPGVVVPDSLASRIDARASSLGEAGDRWDELDFEASERLLADIESTTPPLEVQLAEATRIREAIDALPKGPELPEADGIDVTELIERFDSARVAAERHWNELEFESAAARIEDAQRLLADTALSIRRLQADSSRIVFAEIWHAADNAARKAAADEDDVDEVDRLDGSAAKWFEIEKFEEAQADWNRAADLARITLARGAEGANALAVARRNWEGREKQPDWTLPQKELANRFDVARQKALEASELEEDGRVTKATSVYIDANTRWNQANAEARKRVTDAWNTLDSDVDDIWVMDKAIKLLLEIEPGNIRLEEAGQKMAFRKGTPRDGMRLPYPLTDGESIDLVYIEPGIHSVGDPAPDRDVVEDRDYRRIRISRGYWISATEVTQAQYEAVMGVNPSRLPGDRLPVTNVSWVDACVFAGRIKAVSGLDRSGEAIRYQPRLPTEVEWEIAARSGERHADFQRPLEQLAWYDGNSAGRPHPVGGLADNGDVPGLPESGINDALGNVSEWCYDYHSEDWLDHLVDDDPGGPRTGDARTIRGGSFLGGRDEVALTFRRPLATNAAASDVGFRLVLSSVVSPEQITADERLERKDPLLRGIPDGNLEFKTVSIDGVPVEFVRLPIAEDGGFLWMSTTEVTNRLWSAAGALTGREIGGPNEPAVNMTLYDTDKFFRSIRKTIDGRLPTMAEWSRACRAGGKGPYAIGDSSRSDDLDRFAWLGLGPTAKVRRVAYDKKPTYWGLYDIHGNAEEWCAAVGRRKDSGPVMGGSVRSTPLQVGVDVEQIEPGSMFNEVRGFRLVAEKLP